MNLFLVCTNLRRQQTPRVLRMVRRPLHYAMMLWYDTHQCLSLSHSVCCVKQCHNILVNLTLFSCSSLIRICDNVHVCWRPDLCRQKAFAALWGYVLGCKITFCQWQNNWGPLHSWDIMMIPFEVIYWCMLDEVCTSNYMMQSASMWESIISLKHELEVSKVSYTADGWMFFGRPRGFLTYAFCGALRELMWISTQCMSFNIRILFVESLSRTEGEWKQIVKEERGELLNIALMV